MTCSDTNSLPLDSTASVSQLLSKMLELELALLELHKARQHLSQTLLTASLLSDQVRALSSLLAAPEIAKWSTTGEPIH